MTQTFDRGWLVVELPAEWSPFILYLTHLSLPARGRVTLDRPPGWMKPINSLSCHQYDIPVTDFSVWICLLSSSRRRCWGKTQNSRDEVTIPIWPRNKDSILTSKCWSFLNLFDSASYISPAEYSKFQAFLYQMHS